jgi:hypothetical protein
MNTSTSTWSGARGRLVGAVLLSGVLALLTVALPSCGDETGVCTACCGPSGRTYCKDDWTADECSDWSAKKVNGLTWAFHGGQTCSGRGTPATP